MKLKLLLYIFFFIIPVVQSQELQLTPNAEISVLTIGPGESLNDAFGHNGFRIKDKDLGIDLVYGYGDYDFDEPNFYLKFAQGKLNYLLSRHKFKDIYNHYVYYNRTIEEHVLNLSTIEKQRLFNYLENNYKPENRHYLYDFFYDNCATRIRDVTQNSTNSAIQFSQPKDFKNKTYRDLIHEHVKLNTWGSFGIDIALGSVIDRKASVEEYMFLPKYINAFFENARINSSENLVKSSTTLYKQKETNSSSNFLLSPLVVMSLLAFIILFITYKDYKKDTQSKWLDIIIFGTTGLIGLLLLFLWFATDHSATAYNYNLLWAFPLNLLCIAQLLRSTVSSWFKRYLKLLVIMLCLMTLHWLLGIQVFAIGLIPLIIALFIRYIYLIKYFK